MKVGILGCGWIATKMAEAMHGVEGVECYAVASRTLEKAKQFAEMFKFQKAYGSYEELAKDSNVDLIYIATPHSHHFQNGMLCVENGRNILVEKAFTITPEQAKSLLDLARQRNVFVCEAIWTRFMPARDIINGIISCKEVGEVRTITASLGYPLMKTERLLNPALGGGSMLDLGVYPINFAMMHAGAEVKSINAYGILSDQKIDLAETIHVEFENGVVATLQATMQSATDRRGMIYCTDGYIEVININNPEAVNVYDNFHNRINSYKIPKQINGYEYELISSLECIKNGQIETKEMPHAETIKVMTYMDKLLKDMGVVHTCK